MTKLFTEEEFENAKGMDKLPLQCEQCGKTFYVEKKMIKYVLNHQDGKWKSACRFCSRECFNKSVTKKFKTVCETCGKEIEVKMSEHRKHKTGYHFCSKSCVAKFFNKMGISVNRSKLERYIEEKLTELYPDLPIVYNDRLTIGTELDIYIPSLRLAFELNGAYHYEPIYGEKTFNKVKEDDKNKFQLCQENKISLCIIDTSKLKYLIEKNAKPYLDIIQNIINENISRNSV